MDLLIFSNPSIYLPRNWSSYRLIGGSHRTSTGRAGYRRVGNIIYPRKEKRERQRPRSCGRSLLTCRHPQRHIAPSYRVTITEARGQKRRQSGPKEQKEKERRKTKKTKKKKKQWKEGMGSNSTEISIREGGSRENGRNNTITRINQIAPTQVRNL
ncbi:hypothetical protein B296_00011931 [Ensete ventricosum]|uniref:Uncharacterized protein n=1 Tax=Ensete ventricosum TaxID=4639 RepID=A0A427B8S4_ENSVE|nr:hypothetical protein B296_00011931 [Ensete ventricosum]